MTAEAILKELEELADRSGITLRFEKGDFDGGYCVLKAERMIVVNRKLAAVKKASVVAQAIAEVGVDEVYLKPAVRDFIEEELSKANVSNEVPLAGHDGTIAAPADAPGVPVASAELETAVLEPPPPDLPDAGTEPPTPDPPPEKV